MNALLFNGSPKAEKSDTLKLGKAFLEGNYEPYEQIDLIRMNIPPCRGCLTCWYQTPGLCAQGGDVNRLLSKISTADLIVWSMPLYCYGMPSHVKALVDHLITFNTQTQVADSEGHTHHGVRGRHQAKHVLVAGCGFPDYEGNFDALSLQFQRLFGNESPIVLCAEAPMLSAPEADIVTKPYLSLVQKAGEEFAKTGMISKETQRLLSQPMIDPELYRSICNSHSA